MRIEINDLTADHPQPRRAFGSRRLTLDSQRWRNEAERFAGLPAGCGTPHRMLALVKAAAPAMGLNGTDQRLMDKLFQYTRAIDWVPPSRPIVAVSNEVLAEDLSLSRSAVQRALRRCQEHGLIVMKDSPTGQRYFRRSAQTGAIEPARSFGIDLSIVAVRAAELQELADRHDAAKRARRDARRRATIAWRMVAQSIETAEEQGLWSTFWENIEARARRHHGDMARALTLAERQHLAQTLERMAEEARAVLVATFGMQRGDDIDPRSVGRVDATPNNNTEGSNDDPVSAQQEGGSRVAPPPCPSDSSMTAPRTEPEPTLRIDPIEIARLVPELRAHAGPAPTWADLGAACETIRAACEINHRLWDRAHAALGGPQRRIIAFADMLTYPDNHFTKGRGAYFAGMVKLAETGRLNLGSSLYGMRQRGSIDRPLAGATGPSPAPATVRSIGMLAQRLGRKAIG